MVQSYSPGAVNVPSHNRRALSKGITAVIFRLHRSTVLIWPIVTDGVAWSDFARSVWLSVKTVSPAKTSELIEMPFGILTGSD